jgi:hypothetical protein
MWSSLRGRWSRQSGALSRDRHPLAEAQPLRLLALDPHDLALSTLARNSAIEAYFRR